MAKAVWNGTVIAESDKIISLEGYTYFPESAVRKALLRYSQHHTT